MRTFALGLVIGIWLCVVPGRAAPGTAEVSPPPGSWVADTANLLNEADRAVLNRLGNAVHAADSDAALFVITIESTAGMNHRDFATEQLNRFGPRGRLASGVLILIARADRKAELVLGDALLRRHGTTASDRIMRDMIVASMRRGDPREALLGSARECARVYFSVVEQPDGSVRRNEPAPAGNAQAVAAPSAPDEVQLERPSSPSVPAARSAPAAAAPSTRTHQSRVAPPSPAKSSGVANAVILAFVGVVVVGGIGGLVVLANRPKRCPTCRLPMVQLGPAEEAPHLNPAERTEERVGSVDYVIWHCAPCRQFEKVRHGKWFSGFSGCPQCHAETRREAKRTLRTATTWSTGLLEIVEHCEHCGYHHVSQRTIPRVRESHRSGSSGSGFGGGGGSRGGGRSSSGGGSSGSW